MRRRLLKYVIAMSLLLCVATLALWVWSFGGSDYLEITIYRLASKAEISSVIILQRGHLEMQFQSTRYHDVYAWNEAMAVMDSPPWFTYARSALNNGFPKEGATWSFSPFFDVEAEPDGSRPPRFRQCGLELHMPVWAFSLGFALPVAIAVFRWRRKPRHAWLCRVCSYNLTSNISGICPECGNSVKAIA